MTLNTPTRSAGSRFGGEKNPAAKKKAITAIARTLLKIACQMLRSGKPYQDLGADFYLPDQERTQSTSIRTGNCPDTGGIPAIPPTATLSIICIVLPELYPQFFIWAGETDRYRRPSL